MVEERQGRAAVGRHSIDRRVERGGMEEVVKPDRLHVVRQLRVTSLDQLEQAAQRRERHATQHRAVRGKLRPLRDLQDARRRAANGILEAGCAVVVTLLVSQGPNKNKIWKPVL